MPRRNRVTPAGELIATPERGALMGNRGVLHDGAGNVKRAWQVKRWIACVLDFKGRKLAVMAPGRYTQLFFLDEATAPGAGHRPCAECRRERFNAFRAALAVRSAEEIDARLHAERLAADGSKRTFAALDDLPDGTFVALDGAAFLVRGAALLRWSPGGYTERRPRPTGGEAAVLTPPATVTAIRAGYSPQLHPSAAGGTTK